MFKINAKSRPKLMVDSEGKLKTGSAYECITKQASAKNCDLNKIIAKFKRTGQLPRHKRPAFYGDFRGNADLQTQIDIVRSAEKKFNSLPSEIRARFKNNPVELVKFCNDSANQIEARKLGLSPLVEPTPTMNKFGETITPKTSPKDEPAE